MDTTATTKRATFTMGAPITKEPKVKSTKPKSARSLSKAARTIKGGAPRFSRLTPATAVGASKELLSELISRHGQAGDRISTMAHSPAVFSGYLQLDRAIKRSKLNRGISERFSIAIQVQ